MDDLNTCNSCKENYEESKRPHFLPCGHTICSTCIVTSIRQQNMFSEGSVKCPHCQKSHRASNVEDFPVNYTLESVLEKLRDEKQGPLPNGARSLKSRAQAVVTEQKKSLKRLIKKSQGISSDITKYNNYLQERKATHVKLLEHNEKVISIIEAEEKKLVKTLKEGEDQQREANANAAANQNLTAVTDIESESEKLERIYENLASWNKKCEFELPNEQIISTSLQVAKGIMDAFGAEPSNEDETASASDLAKPSSSLSVMEKVDKSIEENYSIIVNQIRDSVLRFRAGNVCAVHIKNGRVQHARVTSSSNQVYLHHLEDGEPPQNCLIVKLNDVLEMLNTDQVVAFLDLAWEGSNRGRVHILLSPNTPLARHFKVLCTGELGASYYNTTFLEVVSKGNVCSEFIRGGDYEKRDGTGGAPLFTGLRSDDTVYKRSSCIGMLQASYKALDGPMTAQFRIYTGTNVTTGQRNGIFGQVKDGLDVVREAAKVADITKVTIRDCGVQLTL